jgi:hypothetical protein
MTQQSREKACARKLQDAAGVNYTLALSAVRNFVRHRVEEGMTRNEAYEAAKKAIADNPKGAFYLKDSLV